MTNDRLPNLIVVGVGKAGTTSLFWYLSQHPEVCASSTKEIGYFATPTEGDGALPPVATYAAHFRHCRGQPYRLEASPQYFHGGPPVIQAIRAVLGRPKVIVTFRDPVQRVWSQYRFMRSRLADLPGDMTFDGYVDRCLEVRERREPLTEANRLYWTVRGGLYVEHLPPWVAEFGDDLRIVFFERLVGSPAAEVRSICRWLGVDEAAAAVLSYSVENRTVDVRSRMMQRLALAANSERFLGRRRRLKDPLRRLYYAINRAAGEEPRMSEGARRRLEAAFAPANAALAVELRRLGYTDLPAWVQSPAASVSP